MIELPEQFKIRMKNLLGDSYGDFLASYGLKPRKAIRVNTLKTDVERFKEIFPLPLGSGVPWEQNGFYVDTDKAGKTVLHAAGLYYVQEPSAMCAAPLLQTTEGEKVLDMCSAPGGKGTQLAQRMNGNGIIVLNEINFSRAKILSQNVERLGIRNAVVTCASPAEIAEAFNGYFDKIIVDAPCSGEGMFKKEPQAVQEWSEANVAACATRQRDILACAAAALKSGGKLVYSTCTFAPEEDEEQIAHFLEENKNFGLIKSVKLYPHLCDGEGHFAALLKKTDGGENTVKSFKCCFADKKLQAVYRKWEEETLNVRFERLHLVGDALYSIPDECPAVPVQALRVGVRLGIFKNGRFQPDHSLAMALSCGQSACVEVSEATALAYLSGNTFACEGSADGWRIVTYLGYSLGWCKTVGGVAKNHLPKGLRI